MIDLEREEDEAYERLLDQIREVFGPEIDSHAYNKTQEAILNTMIAQAIDRSGGIRPAALRPSVFPLSPFVTAALPPMTHTAIIRRK